MTETAALVPIPFYAPAYTGTGAFDPYHNALPRLLVLPPMPQIARSDPMAGLAYSREGNLIGDGVVGTLVDIYA